MDMTMAESPDSRHSAQWCFYNFSLQEAGHNVMYTSCSLVNCIAFPSTICYIQRAKIVHILQYTLCEPAQAEPGMAILASNRSAT